MTQEGQPHSVAHSLETNHISILLLKPGLTSSSYRSIRYRFSTLRGGLALWELTRGIRSIIDDNGMTRERGLTLTLDQLTRIDPLRSDPAPKPTLSPLSSPPPHPSLVVQCYCAYACHVNSRIRATKLHTGWIVPVGMQFHHRSHQTPRGPIPSDTMTREDVARSS